MKYYLSAVLLLTLVIGGFASPSDPIMGPANEHESKSIVLGLEKRPGPKLSRPLRSAPPLN